MLALQVIVDRGSFAAFIPTAGSLTAFTALISRMPFQRYNSAVDAQLLASNFQCL
jgi:hypothetical protein